MTLGFANVFRYTAGKMDWFASGLPREGRMASHPRAGDVARRDVPTCGLRERVGVVARRVREAGWDLCVVVDDDRVVLGLLDAVLAGDPAALAETVMRSAPTTLRPHITVEEVAQRLESSRTDQLLVTDGDGRLLGLVRRSDAERRASESRAHAVPS